MSSSKHSYFAFLDDSFGDKALFTKIALTRRGATVYYVKQSLCSVSTQRRLFACVLPARYLEIYRNAFTLVTTPIICKISKYLNSPNSNTQTLNKISWSH